MKEQEVVPMSTTFKVAPRRRRKRLRPNNDENRQPTTAPVEKKCLPSLDDTELKFLDSDGNFLSDGVAASTSLPLLLAKRQSGRCRNPHRWQQQALRNHIKKPLPGLPARQWRPFSRRSLPFTQLGTPHSDAVLAMDRKGSYALSLGSKDLRNAPLALTLRFYGIPSRAAVNSQRGYIAPLLRTVPLLYDIQGESMEEQIFNFRRNVSPSTTPVKILLSSDWRVGVAMFQPSDVWCEEGTVGTLVVFATPGAQKKSCLDGKATIWQCTNVKMGTGPFFTSQNLLWHVEILPTQDLKDGPATKFTNIHNKPGFLVLNDEEDGFRMTWIAEECRKSHEIPEQIKESNPVCSIVPTNSILSIEDSWERIDSDLLTGERLTHTKGTPSGPMISAEAFLSAEMLLGDILSKRKGMSEHPPADYSYNFVSVLMGGRVAEFVITFIRSRRPGSLGVYIRVDLFTGMYEELGWVKNTAVCDPSALRYWCNVLAINRRMRELRVGPYSVKSDQSMDWSSLCIDKGFDEDEEDDFSPSFWKEYVESSKAVCSRKPPKLISMHTLYPDCEFVTNKAITNCTPVNVLKGKDSSTELVYG